MPARPRQSRMFAQNRGIPHAIKIGIHNGFAVEYYDNLPPFGSNFLPAPLPSGLLESLFSGNYVIDRPVILRRTEPALVTRSAIVEDLDLHALIRRIPLVRRPYADAVIRSPKEA